MYSPLPRDGHVYPPCHVPPAAHRLPLMLPLTTCTPPANQTPATYRLRLTVCAAAGYLLTYLLTYLPFAQRPAFSVCRHAAPPSQPASSYQPSGHLRRWPCLKPTHATTMSSPSWPRLIVHRPLISSPTWRRSDTLARTRTRTRTARPPLTSHLSPLTPNLSPLTPHLSPLTSHLSPLTPQLSPLTSHLSPLTSHPSPITHHPGARRAADGARAAQAPLCRSVGECALLSAEIPAECSRRWGRWGEGGRRRRCGG